MRDAPPHMDNVSGGAYVDPQIVTIALIALLVIAVAAVTGMAMRRRRRQELRSRFGPEYEHVVEEEGSVGRAERVLSAREQRVKKLDIRPLPETARDQFRDRWGKVQERFVDDPPGAVSDADALIGEAMEARGYPVGDFEQRAADVSVEHPGVVRSYRAAHEIAVRSPGDITTEDLRTAMVQYRALFSELVRGDVAPEREVEREPEETRP